MSQTAVELLSTRMHKLYTRATEAGLEVTLDQHSTYASQIVLVVRDPRHQGGGVLMSQFVGSTTRHYARVARNQTSSYDAVSLRQAERTVSEYVQAVAK